ncbi:7TM diverse intracellular signaling domain-containing protein [Nemorincola caseinilytica]|uniref:histidine kinase n=1 Tax=Nemorincola caseinilytica TaxID=2054315 RepID=A0ABP8NJD8_9BACT
MSVVAGAQNVPPITISDPDKNYLVTTGVEYIEDKTHSLTYKDVVNAHYEVWPKGIPNFATTSSAYWLRIRLRNESSTGKLMLRLSAPTTDSVFFYEPIGDSGLKAHSTGAAFPFGYREKISSDLIFPVSVTPGTEKYVYLKASSTSPLLLPLSTGTNIAISDSDKYKDIFWGMYMGLMLAMLLYNFFVYLTTRDASYLFYIGYVLAVILAQITLSGYGFQLLWPKSPWFSIASTYLTPPLAGITGMEFLRHFLRTREHIPRAADRGFFILYILYGIAIVAALAGKYTITYNVIDMTASLVSIYMLVVAIVIWRKGYRPAGFFLVAWVAFLIGVFIFVFKNFNILPYNIFTAYTMPVGSAMEVILLSFALADRINILKKEKEKHQAEAIAALEENEKIIREQNVVLEQKVTERTYELKRSNDDLNKALTDLKEAETQLVESEKMASLGQLTAGIAHEINNPINFVTSNVKPLNRDVLILLDTVKELEQIATSDMSAGEKAKAIENYKTDIDYEYLQIEIDQLLNGIGEGASRTAEIVKGLRIFSRLDEDDLKKADINEGLNSTLIITNNMLNNTIAVAKSYANLPLIECYPGKLNQVFLNMISNAVYAIRKKYGEAEGGVLSITTTFDESNVHITIGDNGTGMDENTKKRLFEPFFTTKDVGEGTGLGMSIAYNTINKHHGQININSELGRGTEFIITLPLIQK